MDSTSIKRKPGTIHIVLTAVFAGIMMLLQFIGVMGFAISFGAVALAPAIAVQVMSAAWFGMWGVLAAVVGTCLGNIVGGYPALLVAQYAILANFSQAFIPAVAFRAFKTDPSLRSAKDWAVYLLFGVGLNMLVGGAYGSGVFWLLGFTTFDYTWFFMFPMWVFANVLSTLVFTTPVLKFASPYIKRSRGYCTGWTC